MDAIQYQTHSRTRNELAKKRKIEEESENEIESEKESQSENGSGSETETGSESSETEESSDDEIFEGIVENGDNGSQEGNEYTLNFIIQFFCLGPFSK